MKIKNQEHFQALWRKYLPVIALKLRQTIRNGEAAQIGMYAFEFQTNASKRKTGHQFNLELKNGKVVNDSSSTVAAKELNSLMKEDYNIYSLLEKGHFQFSLDSDFRFTISKVTPESISNGQ